jgi:hypothetical protein
MDICHKSFKKIYLRLIFSHREANTNIMNPSITVYNAFTGMSISERQQLLLFIKAHLGKNSEIPCEQALDYALKLIPSFGGFVIVAYQDIFPIGCLIVNKTGMEGFGPGHIISVAYQHPQFTSYPEIMATLITKAIEFTGGDVSYYLRPDRLQKEFIRQFKAAIGHQQMGKLKAVGIAVA